jgi:hypothetical protein
MSILEVWADSGETVERERTPDEQAQYDADMANLAAEADEAAAKATADAAAVAAAVAHAKSLGFTDAMIANMWPSLVGGEA